MNNIFSGLIDFILDLFLKVLSFINGLIFAPVHAIIMQFVPNIDSYFSDVYLFINNYMLKGVAFAREVFFNLTGFPRGLFDFLMAFLLFKFTFMILKWGLQRLANAYYLVRGSKS